MIFERNCDAIVDEFPPREPSDFLTPRLRPTCDGQDRQMSALGLVSRASPVQTAVRNCTRDEGGPFGFGDQVADPKPPQAAVVKSHGGERCGNAGTMIPAGTVERGERKRTVSEVSKAD